MQGAALVARLHKTFGLTQLSYPQLGMGCHLNGKCSHCRQFGHFVWDHPQPKYPLRAHPTIKLKAPEIFPWCCWGRHWANECRSETHVQGLTLLGNSQWAFPGLTNNGGPVCSSFICPSQCRTIQQLCWATPRSTGLDLSPTSRLVLTPDVGPQLIPNGV